MTTSTTNLIRTCRQCQGAGEFDIREMLDFDDPRALLSEIAVDVNLDSPTLGLQAESAAERCRSAARLALLVSRLAWLHAVAALDEAEAHRQFNLGDLVYLADRRGPCPICGKAVTQALGAVVALGHQDRYDVELIQHCSGEPRRFSVTSVDMRPVEEPETIHASPVDVAAAISRGWLEPGSEFYGCQFRG